MNMLAVIMLAVFASVFADNSLVNPPNLPTGADPCYKCTDFSPQGQGFVAYGDPVFCCRYYECWKTQGATSLRSVERTCPDGTWFNPNYSHDNIYDRSLTVDTQEFGEKGNPCIANKPYPQCLLSCPAPTPTYPTPPCSLFPKDSDQRLYGHCSPAPATFPYTQVPGPTCPDADFSLVNECAAGFEFDYASCTCLGPLKSAPCMVDMPLAVDIFDHSHIQGAIMPSGPPVQFGQVPFPHGIFTGLSKLNDQALSGMYGCSVKKLSVGVFFNANSVSGKQGIVSYGSCDAFTSPQGSSYGIYVDNNNVVASIGAHTVSAPINAGQWYYVSFVYSRRGKTNNFKLYVMSPAQATACDNNNCPAPADQTTTGHACVESRPCGLDVGFTGTTDDVNQFFDGEIAGVQVYHGKNIMACGL